MSSHSGRTTDGRRVVSEGKVVLAVYLVGAPRTGAKVLAVGCLVVPNFAGGRAFEPGNLGADPRLSVCINRPRG